MVLEIKPEITSVIFVQKDLYLEYENPTPAGDSTYNIFASAQKKN